MSLHTGGIPIATSGFPVFADGERAGSRAWFALAVLCLPVLLVSMDNTILNFALPAIARDMGPTASQQLWIIDSYSLVLAGLLVTMGTLGDRFGRLKILLIAAIGFTAVSVLAVFAPSAGWVIAARIGMGVFGAAIMPSTMSLLRSLFLNRDQRRLALAIWGGMFSAGGALGPIVGGLLIEHFPWQSVFLVAVPMLALTLAFAPFVLRESRDPNPGSIDPASFALSIASLGLIAYGIKQLTVYGWSGLVPVFLGVLVGWMFVRRQLRSPSPILDMSLFRRGAFSGSVTINLLGVTALVGFLYFASQHLQLVVGLSPIVAGLMLVPGAILTMVGGLVAAPIAARTPPTVVVPTALMISAAAYVLIALAGAEHVWAIVVGFGMLGLGLGGAQTVSGDLVLSTAPKEKAGAASAVSETGYEFGAVLGTSILGGLLTGWYRSTLDLPADLAPNLAARASETLGDAMNVATEVGGPLGEAVREAAAHAFDGGVVLTSLIGAGLVTLGAVIGATTLDPRRKRAAKLGESS